MKITRKNAIKTLGLSLVATPLLAKAKKDDFSEFRAEFADAWKSSLTYTLDLFNQMPEDKLNWKYTPESFTWRMQFVHCIIFNATQLATRLELKDPYHEVTMKGGYWGKMTKSQLREQIEIFYAWVQKVANETPDSKLAELSSFGSDDIPNWRLFYALENHIIHHRGQAVCYLRLNDITPIGYVGW